MCGVKVISMLCTLQRIKIRFFLLLILRYNGKPASIVLIDTNAADSIPNQENVLAGLSVNM